MRYCPTCGHEVSDTQKFCPNCSTKLSGVGAPTDAPPADVSNTVPHRPGGGWSLENDDLGTDDIDDFFSSYRRKGPAATPPAEAPPAEVPPSEAPPAAEEFPTRRSRRRFQPDLSYDATPLPAAPQPDAPRPAVPGAAGPEATYLPEVDNPDEGVDEVAPMSADDPENDFTRPSPVMFRAQQPKPVSAPAADESQVPHWFEELDRPGDDDALPRENAWAALAPGQTPGAPAPSRPIPAGNAEEAEGERAFDDLIATRGASDDKAAQPIVSRDFDRTGIVHVPRLDEGADQRPTAEAAAQQPSAQQPPVEPAPVQPAPGQPAPVESTPVQQEPVWPAPAPQEPLWPAPVQSENVQPESIQRASAEEGSAPQSPAQPDVDAPWYAPETGQGPAIAPLPPQDGWRSPHDGWRSPQDGWQSPSDQVASPFQAPVQPAEPQETGDPFSAPSGAYGASDADARTDSMPPAAAGAAAAGAAAAQQGRGAEEPRDIFADWFGEEDEQLTSPQPSAPPRAETPPQQDRPQVDPEVERQRPWYEQGLDGTEETGQQPPFGAGAAAAGAAGIAGATAAGRRTAAAPASAPTYEAHGAGPAGAGASGAHTRGGAPVDARGAGAGPGGTRGPGGRPPGDGGSGGGGIGGAVANLDETGKRRLLMIAITLGGAILLIASAFIIGNVIGGRDGDQAAPVDSPVATAPEETAAEPAPAGPPPAVADPNFEAVAFQSESGNLRCIITPEYGVACQHSSPAFTIPAAVCKTTGQSGAVVGLDSNGYTYPCLEEDIPYGQEILPMDEPIHAGEFACTITLETGVSCFNAAGDVIGLEFELGIGTSGRASVSPQPTIPIPEVAQ